MTSTIEKLNSAFAEALKRTHQALRDLVAEIDENEKTPAMLWRGAALDRARAAIVPSTVTDLVDLYEHDWPKCGDMIGGDGYCERPAGHSGQHMTRISSTPKPPSMNGMLDAPWIDYRGPEGGYRGIPRETWPKPIEPPPIIRELASHLGRTSPSGAATPATIDECALLPDGSGVATMSFELPKDHWLYAPYTEDGVECYEPPPMSLRMLWHGPVPSGPVRGSGTWSLYGEPIPQFSHRELADALRAAGRYAIRAATMDGKEKDFDPDALIQNLVVCALGYHTPDGLTKTGDEWANPPHLRGIRTGETHMDGNQTSTGYGDARDARIPRTLGSTMDAGAPPSMTLDETPQTSARLHQEAERYKGEQAQAKMPSDIRSTLAMAAARLRQEAERSRQRVYELMTTADELDALLAILPLDVEKVSPGAARALLRLLREDISRR